ncbi:transposase family protein [Devosia psychrophila]|uniref:transposase family protein n=1 Tax=Devosia psychrophila TaxID=728005 RepID=UPI000945DC03
MAMNMRISFLIPAGLVVASITETEAEIVVLARAAEPEGLCPLCGIRSRRIHSRYLRTVSDLPCAGRRVKLRLMAQRFVCNAPFCRRKIFAERFVRRQIIWLSLGRRLAECQPRLWVDVMRRACGAASADARWSFVCSFRVV